MRQIGVFGGSTALWALLTAHVAAAFEPVSVGIAIGAVSALTGYLSYTDFYCRFTECCREDRPLNTSGMCPRAGRGGRKGGRWELRSHSVWMRRRGRLTPLGPRHTFAGLGTTALRTERLGAGGCAPSVGVRHAAPSKKPAFGSCWFFSLEPSGVAGKLARSTAARCFFPG